MGHFMLFCLFALGFGVCLFEGLPKEVTLEPRPKLLLIHKAPRGLCWVPGDIQRTGMMHLLQARPEQTLSLSQQAKEGPDPRENSFPASASPWPAPVKLPSKCCKAEAPAPGHRGRVDAGQSPRAATSVNVWLCSYLQIKMQCTDP